MHRLEGHEGLLEQTKPCPPLHFWFRVPCRHTLQVLSLTSVVLSIYLPFYLETYSLLSFEDGTLKLYRTSKAAFSCRMMN